jgi:vancomycin resistance protein YoaR
MDESNPEQPAPEQPEPEQPEPEQPEPEQPEPEQPALEQPEPEQPAPEPPLAARQPTTGVSGSKLGELLGRPGARSAAMIAIGSLAGLLIGFLLVPRAPGPGDPKAPPPEVRLLGEPLAMDDEAGRRALERVRRYAAGPISFTLPEGKKRELYLGRLGAEIDKVRLADLVRDARDATSPLRRVWQRASTNKALELPVPIAIKPEAALEALYVLKDELDRLPVDARLDLEKRQLIPEVNGRLLDADATLAALQTAVEQGERSVAIVFEERKPRRLAAQLGNVQFDDVLGWFETRYNRSQRYQARTYNLRLAASKLDGYVLLPGEEFDFNEIVGPRDEANGYKVAPVIAEGELVDGIGGGTCQISGTLHGAAFFAGLDIVERYPHTRPSSYIKMGLDATVVYPTITFRVKNPYPHPIVMHQSVKNGIVRAEILGPKRSRTVTLVRRIDSVVPYEEVERPDKDVPQGVRVLGQRGVPGFRLHRYRIVRDGTHAVRERWNDVYPPTQQIIRVGTAPITPDSVKPEDDPHPEYVADELLVLTQGLDVDGAEQGEKGGGLLEQREPGKYGEYGWSEKMGMPFWRGDGAAKTERDGEGDSDSRRETKTPPRPAEKAAQTSSKPR